MHICHPGFLCLFVCSLKFVMKLFYLSNFSAIYTESIKMSMSQNFRSNGILSVAEMPFMQPVKKKAKQPTLILSTILSHHLIHKISWGCHKPNICISVVTCQRYKSGWKPLYWKTSQYFVWNSTNLSSWNLPLCSFSGRCWWRYSADEDCPVEIFKVQAA